MKNFLLWIKNLFESAMVGAIAYMVVFAISQAYLDSLKEANGVILSSEVVGLQWAPYIAGITIAGFWMKILSDKE